MHTLALCLFALACSVSAEVEELVAADTARTVEKRSLDDDFEKMLQQLEKKYVPESKAESKWVGKEQKDIYLVRGFRPVYSDQTVRDQDKMTSVTEAQKQTIIDLHNERRRREGSSNMEKLYWNEEIASRAQKWCERCVFEHGDLDGVGQNMFAHSTQEYDTFLLMAHDSWYDEKPEYDYNSANCRGMCGHYTQVTWADSNHVGCGLCFCNNIGGNPNSHFVVCNYTPKGNHFGSQKNNLKGPPCTQCSSGKFYCDDGLCDSKCSSAGPNCECKADCKKCGEKDESACGCKCKEGTTGADCSEECRDIDPTCNQNPGYPPMTCDMWDFVPAKCPKMCNLCKGAPADAPPCNQKEEGKSLKRLMLAFLQKEQKEGRLDKK